MPCGEAATGVAEGHVLGEGLLDGVVEPDHPEHADGVPARQRGGTDMVEGTRMF